MTFSTEIPRYERASLTRIRCAVHDHAGIGEDHESHSVDFELNDLLT